MDILKKFAFVVGGAVLIFAAVRNSLTWHLQKFWGASGDFWNRQWVKIHDFYGGDEFVLGMWGKRVLKEKFVYISIIVQYTTHENGQCLASVIRGKSREKCLARSISRVTR